MQESCKHKKFNITEADLPLCCPLPQTDNVSSHPRVYIPIDESKPATCKYCGCEYTLISADK